MKKYLKKVAYYLWVLYGHIGWKLRLQTPHKLTVLITYYNPVRIKHINHQIRNLLKCNFVERIIISCHNPEVKIEDHVEVTDPRLVLLNQNVQRGCGYRWQVAGEFSPDYLIVIDDDILLFSFQLKLLFKHLIEDPKMPHGLSGMIRLENGDLQFYQRENIDVHYLCEVYAVAKNHLEQYFKMVKVFEERDKKIFAAVERVCDFIVISQTGAKNPKIHKAGRIFRDESFNVPGVAMHKEERFSTVVADVSQAVTELHLQLFG